MSSEAEDPPDSTPPARPLRSMHTGQGPPIPESAVPHTEQAFASSMFLDMVVPRDCRSPKLPALNDWRTILQFQIEKLPMLPIQYRIELAFKTTFETPERSSYFGMSTGRVRIG